MATILECHVRGEKGEARTNYTVHWRERGAGVRCAEVKGGGPKGKRRGAGTVLLGKELRYRRRH